MRNSLRSFAVDAIERADLLEDESADEVNESRLEKVLGTGYGIFAGERTHKAVLRFTPEAARWVSREKWHSSQQGEYEPDGSYRLTVPYADATELTMDILRHGRDVEVISPERLRKSVYERLRAATALYEQ